MAALGAHNATALPVGGSLTTTGGSGTAFVFFVGWFRGAGADAAPTSVTDTKSNTWAIVGSVITFAGSANAKGAVYECVAGTGGAAHVVTANFTNANDVCSVWFMEATGLLTSSPRDQAPAGLSDTASPYTSNNITTTVNNEIILACEMSLSNSGTEAITQGNSFTGDDAITNADTSFTGTSAHRIVTSTGTYQTSATSTGAGTTEMVSFIISFKDVTETGGGGAFGGRRLLLGVGRNRLTRDEWQRPEGGRIYTRAA